MKAKTTEEQREELIRSIENDLDQTLFISTQFRKFVVDNLHACNKRLTKIYKTNKQVDSYVIEQRLVKIEIERFNIFSTSYIMTVSSYFNRLINSF